MKLSTANVQSPLALQGRIRASSKVPLIYLFVANHAISPGITRFNPIIAEIPNGRRLAPVPDDLRYDVVKKVLHSRLH